MNEQVKQMALKSGIVYLSEHTAYLQGNDGLTVLPNVDCLEKFAQLIAEHCAQLCGSQADSRNLRYAFGLPVESQVKYPAPEAHGSVTSQYEREYNLPK